MQKQKAVDSKMSETASGSKFVTLSTSSSCCLIENSKRCFRPAGSHCFSKRMQKTVRQKRLKFVVDSKADHNMLCHFHRQHLILEGKKSQNTSSANSASKRSFTQISCKGESGGVDEDSPRSSNHSTQKPKHPLTVNFEHLSVNALKRYKKFFKLQTRPGMNKGQLADVIGQHFSSIPVQNEKDILTYFVYAVKMKKNKLDQSSGKQNSVIADDRDIT